MACVSCISGAHETGQRKIVEFQRCFVKFGCVLQCSVLSFWLEIAVSWLFVDRILLFANYVVRIQRGTFAFLSLSLCFQVVVVVIFQGFIVTIAEKVNLMSATAHNQFASVEKVANDGNNNGMGMEDEQQQKETHRIRYTHISKTK